MEHEIAAGDPIPTPVAGDAASVQATLDRLRSYEEIRQLVARYAVAVDACDVDTVAGLFADEADFGDHGRGPDGARRFYAATRARYAVTVHDVGNHLVDFDGPDRARGVVYCRAEHERGDDWTVTLVVYRDQYARSGARWAFRGRQALIFHGGDVGERPNDMGPAEQPEGLTLRGRGRMPSVWPSWGRFWVAAGRPMS